MIVAVTLRWPEKGSLRRYWHENLREVREQIILEWRCLERKEGTHNQVLSESVPVPCRSSRSPVIGKEGGRRRDQSCLSGTYSEEL
jgi:hypothetical protein